VRYRGAVQRCGIEVRYRGAVQTFGTVLPCRCSAELEVGLVRFVEVLDGWLR
jgi:hypothetical protein